MISPMVMSLPDVISGYIRDNKVTRDFYNYIFAKPTNDNTLGSTELGD